MNLGQLTLLIRAKYLIDAFGYNQVRGLPFRAEELADVLEPFILEADGNDAAGTLGVDAP
jgi:2-oxoglutarate ferredoxin oxidoreductase subunit alpha